MSKKLPIYFSDDAWSSLQDLMGPDGKPSPTINSMLEQIAQQAELADQLGLTPVLPQSKVSIPVSLERIPAGPAFSTKDEQGKAIDLNEFLIQNPISTFIAHVDSESMLGVGLEVNDPIIIDRSIEAKHYDIVVALINKDEVTLKRFYREKDHIRLQPANSTMDPIIVKPGTPIEIQGVVIGVIRKY